MTQMLLAQHALTAPCLFENPFLLSDSCLAPTASSNVLKVPKCISFPFIFILALHFPLLVLDTPCFPLLLFDCIFLFLWFSEWLTILRFEILLFVASPSIWSIGPSGSFP